MPLLTEPGDVFPVFYKKVAHDGAARRRKVGFTRHRLGDGGFPIREIREIGGCMPSVAPLIGHESAWVTVCDGKCGSSAKESWEISGGGREAQAPAQAGQASEPVGAAGDVGILRSSEETPVMGVKRRRDTCSGLRSDGGRWLREEIRRQEVILINPDFGLRPKRRESNRTRRGAGNPSVRFDEGREGVGHWPCAFQPILSCLLYCDGSKGGRQAGAGAAGSKTSFAPGFYQGVIIFLSFWFSFH